MIQPWQMTFDQYLDYMLTDKPINDLLERPRESAGDAMRLRLRTKHAALVRKALMNAEPVPEGVLKEYPELWEKRHTGGDT